MNEIQRDNLERFIEFFKQVKPENFNINYPVKCENPTKIENLYEDLKNPSCGTTACVGGMLPVFDKERFYFVQDYSPKFFEVVDSLTKEKGYARAFSNYFGIDYEISKQICYPSYKIYGTVEEDEITPQMVCEKLQALLDGESIYFEDEYEIGEDEYDE